MPAAGGSRFKKSKMMTRQRDTNTMEDDDDVVLKVGKFKSPNTLDVFTRPFLVVEEQFAAPEDSSFLRCPIVPRKDINNKWLGFATASDDGNALLLILAGLLVFSLANIVAASVIFCGRWSGRFFVWKVEKDIVA
jgi:hypothetical protein